MHSLLIFQQFLQLCLSPFPPGRVRILPLCLRLGCSFGQGTLSSRQLSFQVRNHVCTLCINSVLEGGCCCLH